MFLCRWKNPIVFVCDAKRACGGGERGERRGSAEIGRSGVTCTVGVGGVWRAEEKKKRSSFEWWRAHLPFLPPWRSCAGTSSRSSARSRGPSGPSVGSPSPGSPSAAPPCSSVVFFWAFCRAPSPGRIFPFCLGLPGAATISFASKFAIRCPPQ